MRDILQSRYLRRRVAHKQIARTSGVKPTVGFLHYIIEMHRPGQDVGYKNSKKLKRLDLFQDTAACSNERALEIIII